MRVKSKAALVTLALVLVLLAACGGKKAPAPEQGAAAGGESQAATQESDQDNQVCLYLFWSRSPQEAQALYDQVQKGRNFSLAAREVMGQLPEGAARLNATCMPPGQLDPLLAAQLDGLEIGQSGLLFAYQDGTALVMRTTDRYWRQGAELFKQGDYAQAEADLRRHLELHPDASAVWQALAEALAAQDKNDQALEALDQALDHSPDNPAILNDQATLLARMGRWDQAISGYERALSLSPGNPQLLHNLAWALLEQGQDLARAQKLALQAVQMEPGQPRYWDTLGRIQKARGEYTEAVISLHRAASLGGPNRGNQQDLTEALLQLSPAVVARLGQGPQATPTPRPAPAPAPKPATKSPAVDPMGAGAAPLPRTSAPPAPAAAPAPASSQAALPTPPATVPGYYILVGSFRAHQLAAAEMHRWRDRGLSVWLEWKTVPGRGDWVRVMLGPYQKRDTASQEAKAYRQKGWITGYRILSK